MIKERPILFNTDMVRAVLNGSKTQTRRALNHQPDEGIQFSAFSKHGVLNGKGQNLVCKFGERGDRLWVRETFHIFDINDCCNSFEVCGADNCCNGKIIYKADNKYSEPEHKWTPSIHMPRSASRILLEITNVRVERLNDISEEDAIAEGALVDKSFPKILRRSTRSNFEYLWESINGKGSWDLNPYVWCLTFKVLK